MILEPPLHRRLSIEDDKCCAAEESDYARYCAVSYNMCRNICLHDKNMHGRVGYNSLTNLLI